MLVKMFSYQAFFLWIVGVGVGATTVVPVCVCGHLSVSVCVWVSVEEVGRAIKDDSSLYLLPAPGHWDWRKPSLQSLGWQWDTQAGVRVRWCCFAWGLE